MEKTLLVINIASRSVSVGVIVSLLFSFATQTGCVGFFQYGYFSGSYSPCCNSCWLGSHGMALIFELFVVW